MKACYLFFISLILFNFSVFSKPKGTFTRKVNIKYIGKTHVHLARGFRFQYPTEKQFQNKSYRLTIYARSFKQGNLGYLEIFPRRKNQAFLKKPKIYFKKKKVLLASTGRAYHGFFALAPNEKLGWHQLKVSVTIASINSVPLSLNKLHNFWVSESFYPVSQNKIVIRNSRASAGRRISRVLKIKIRRLAKKKRRILKRYRKELFIKNKLSHPRTFHYVTSKFWATRKIARYKRYKNKIIQIAPRIRIHKGLDLRGRKGDPIYTIARGRVVISERMHYEGNFIVIDHGLGLFSGYMHLNKRNVKVGKFVRSGEKIGESGATGAVTGAHLHLFLILRGVSVDPLSLLSLPVGK